MLRMRLTVFKSEELIWNGSKRREEIQNMMKERDRPGVKWSVAAAQQRERHDLYSLFSMHNDYIN